jgi:urate oxidase
MGIILGANQYGKAEIRVVSIDRDTPRHEIHDLSVTTTLQGDFAAAHESGDQSKVLPTDSQKNTVFAFARERGVDQIEDFALDLARHFAETVPAVISARVAIDSYAWDRVGADQTNGAGLSGHDHSLVRRGQDVRTTTVTVGVTGHGPGAWVVSGIKDLVILKSTGSEFRGFFRDRYTTLAETDDRILATSLVARWRYGEPAADWAKAHAGIRAKRLLDEVDAGREDTNARMPSPVSMADRETSAGTCLRTSQCGPPLGTRRRQRPYYTLCS